MRIAFVRSVDLRQAFPALPEAVQSLRLAGHDVAIFVIDTGPIPDVAGAQIIQLDPETPLPEIANRLAAWQPDRIVSISVPDDKALRDACWAESLRASLDLDVVMHPLAATHAFANKWTTRSVVEEVGLPVAPGFLISGDLLSQRGVRYGAYRDYVSLMLNRLNFPVVCKPVWDSMAQGVTTFESQAALEHWLDIEKPGEDLLVEQYLPGELFGIEVVGRDGAYFCQPLVRKCLSRSAGTEPDLVPFNHIRFGPITDPAYSVSTLQARIKELARRLELCGSAEFELMWLHGQFYVIEVNPRVSGMTNLSSAISGINTYAALADSQTAAPVGASKTVVEVPLINMNEAQREALVEAPEVMFVHAVTYHDGSSQWKALVTGPDVRTAVEALAARSTPLPLVPAEALLELEAALPDGAIDDGLDALTSRSVG